MRTDGTPAELEWRRRLAVLHVRSGYPQKEVADFLGVHPRTVQRWMQTCREHGTRGLKTRAASGRPPKLTLRQEREVLRWFRQSPTKFGFTTELWTAPRVAELMLRKLRKRFHPRCLNQWLAQRRITPQKPSPQARERNQREIRRWLREEWPRIKKVRGVGVPISS
jgi:transposase